MESHIQGIVDKVLEVWRAADPPHMPVEILHGRLNREERCAFHFAQLRSEVPNGGFIQWFENGYGCKEAIECLCNEARQMQDTDVVIVFRRIIDQVRSIILYHLAADGAENVTQFMAKWDKLVVEHRLPDDHPHYDLTAALDPFDEQYYAIVDAFDIQIESYVRALSR